MSMRGKRQHAFSIKLSVFFCTRGPRYAGLRKGDVLPPTMMRPRVISRGVHTKGIPSAILSSPPTMNNAPGFIPLTISATPAHQRPPAQSPDCLNAVSGLLRLLAAAGYARHTVALTSWAADAQRAVFLLQRADLRLDPLELEDVRHVLSDEGEGDGTALDELRKATGMPNATRVATRAARRRCAFHRAPAADGDRGAARTSRARWHPLPARLVAGSFKLAAGSLAVLSRT